MSVTCWGSDTAQLVCHSHHDLRIWQLSQVSHITPIDIHSQFCMHVFIVGEPLHHCQLSHCGSEESGISRSCENYGYCRGDHAVYICRTQPHTVHTLSMPSRMAV